LSLHKLINSNALLFLDRYAILPTYLFKNILIQTIIKGYLTGLILSLSFGAGFFSLLHASIEQGYKKGLLIALGMLLSDLVFIALCVFGASFVESQLKELETEMRLMGFVALVILGVSTFIKKANDPKAEQIQPRGNFIYIMKGVMLNIINPLNLLFWLGLAAFVKSSLPTLFEVIIFFSVTLGAMFFNQFIICYSANKVKHLLSVKKQQLLNHIIGIVFVIVALVMVWPLMQKII
jgi:threonine/homoserine/homoserine lactone efflux protein